MSKLLTLFHTVRHLKPIQLWYQVKYRLLKPGLFRVAANKDTLNTVKLRFTTPTPAITYWDGGLTFTFLNESKTFINEVDWTFEEYGKLWNYNLQYANYLHQTEVSNDRKCEILRSLYACLAQNKLPLEPYPVSLRVINVIRWLSEKETPSCEVEGFLHAELDFLSKRLEFHILGNHLLENAFALCMGGAFFSKRDWHERAKQTLRKELDEQVHADGAHFELSPMYHQIILFRVLELVDWYSKYERRDEAFLQFCRQKASDMLAWLDNIRFRNGDIPLFNDAAKGIAHDCDFLFQYAEELDLRKSSVGLGDSGYRSHEGSDYEIKIDFAQVGASYQPGHAHADALSFILYHNLRPLLVEQGTSTYQIGARRNLERSTEAHNTVVVNGANQSEVWGGFRVGRRAKTKISVDRAGVYEGSHDGYKKFGTTHVRRFECEDQIARIIDLLANNKSGIAYFHVHPDRTLRKVSNDHYEIDEHISIRFVGANLIVEESYDYAESYNVYQGGKRLAVAFQGELQTVVNFDRKL